MQVELDNLTQKDPQILGSNHDTQQTQAASSRNLSQSDRVRESTSTNNLVSQNQKPSHIYKLQVDGLRAIAIIIVVIYHAFPQAVPGGLIGVDVFFVISGYLITGIVLRQIEKGRFSFRDFYCRRVKRIYPVLILTLSFGLYVISNIFQENLRWFSMDTLDSSLVFATNIQILLHKKAYFDRDTRDNCLLHLWSLGVQEQFYIIWPVFLLIIFKYLKKHALTLLTVYTFLSFGLSIAIIYYNPKFAFYFPLCRFWQMACGGIMAYLNLKFRNPVINNLLSSVGLTIILIGCYMINDESLFPGFWALIPTIGAMMIIQAGSESFINKSILSSWLFVWIGKISYSLYLWHWPFLVFSKIFFPKGSSSIFSNTYFILFLTFGVSIACYFTIEDRIRKIKGNKVVIVLLVIMGLIGIVSIPLRFQIKIQEKNLISNIDEEQPTVQEIQAQQIKKQYSSNCTHIDQEFRPTDKDFVTVNGVRYPNFSYNQNRTLVYDPIKLAGAVFEQKKDMRNGGEPFLDKNVDENSKYWQSPLPQYISHYKVANEGNKNQLFVIGDSHAKKTTYRFQQLYRQSICANKTDSFPTVLAVVRQAYQLTEQNLLLNFTRLLVKKYKPNRIFFVCNWLCYICKNLDDELSDPFINCNQQKKTQYVAQFVNFVNQIRNQGVQVITNKIDVNVIQLNPWHMHDMAGVIQKNVQPFKYSDYRKKFKSVVDYYENALSNANITMIDMAENLCWEDTCHVVSPKGYGAFVDRDHYGKHYASYWLSVVDPLAKFYQK